MITMCRTDQNTVLSENGTFPFHFDENLSICASERDFSLFWVKIVFDQQMVPSHRALIQRK